MPENGFRDTATDIWKSTADDFWISSSSSVSSSSSSVSSSSSSVSSSSSSSSVSSSSSSESSSSSSSQSSSSSSSADIWAVVWGASSVGADEVQLQWTLWKYRGSATQAKNTGQYGQLLVAPSDEFVSNVRDLGNTNSKYLKVTYDDKDSGSGGCTVDTCASWRGATATYFTQDTELGPTWESYSAGSKTWRYIQIKVTCS